MNMNQKINYLKFSDEEHRSFSQMGEDKFMWGYLKHLKGGHYLDIGSSHPINGNNTYLFYLNNWKGICIDPLLNEDLYKKYRPKDIIYKKFLYVNEKQDFYFCQELPQLSGIENKIQKHFKEKNFTFIKKDVSYIYKDDFIEDFKLHINLMSIDCEELDFDIIKNFIYLFPDVICAEISYELLNELDNILKDYIRLYYNSINVIYVKKTYLQLIDPFN